MLSNSSPYISLFSFFFFFNDTATTEIYTLSLHDALPICRSRPQRRLHRRTAPRHHRLPQLRQPRAAGGVLSVPGGLPRHRSEEHTSELQSPCNLVCRLLLEKKKKTYNHTHNHDDVQEHIL